jgi:hypothetical protein
MKKQLLVSKGCWIEEKCVLTLVCVTINFHLAWGIKLCFFLSVEKNNNL